MKLTALAAIAVLSIAPVSAATLNDVLARMDRQATTFREMSANLTKASFTAVLNDTTTESGRIWLMRKGREILMRTDIGEPDTRSVAVEDEQAEIYYPKINTVQIYDLGKQRSLVDQFLLLGFGSSGKALANSYSIRLVDTEVVNGIKTDRLELTPKSAKVLQQITKVELWIPADEGYPIRQQFIQPGGDYYLVTYSDLKINPGLPESAFRLKLPPGVRKEYPQK